jgi:hypothetical protein
MKLVKMCGLLAVVALLGAAIFTASASATALCEVTGAVCPEGKPYPTETTVEGTRKAPVNVILTTNIATIECTASAWTAVTVADQNGELSTGGVSAWTVGTCSQTAPIAPPPCVVATLGLPYSLGTIATTPGNGTMVFAPGLGSPALKVTCGLIQCTFTFSELPLKVTGAATATASLSTTEMTFAGSKCPKTATLSAEYEITAPTPLFIADEVAPPVLCKENKVPCPALKVLGVGTALKAELGANFKFSYVFNGTKKEPSCTSSKVVGEVTALGRPISGEISKWEFPGGCGGGLCETTAQKLPYEFEIERTGGGNGTLTWSSGGSGGPAVKLKCPGLFEECIYGATEFGFKLEGSAVAPRFYSPTKISLQRESGSSLLCSETATWEGTGGEEVKFKVTSPAALFITS